MITLKCNVDRIRLDDIVPVVVLSKGTVEVDDRLVRRSAKLREAVQKGEVKIVPKAVKRGKPEKGLKKRRTPPPEPLVDYEALHNRFVETVTGLDRQQPVDTETHRLLRQLIDAVNGMSRKLDQQPRTVHVPAPSTPHSETRTQEPQFIPSDLRAPDVKGSRITVSEQTEDGVSDAEDDLRRMMETP